MWRTLFLIIIIGGPLLYIAWEIVKFSIGISGTKSDYHNDIKELSTALKELELSPWNLNELDLLSRQGDSKLETGVYGSVEKGVLYSIYNEPIVGFVKKNYNANDRELVMMRINNDVYSYRHKNGKALDVYLNDNKLGILKKDHLASKLAMPNKDVVIDYSEGKRLYPVKIDNKHVSTINSEGDQDQLRVLQKIDDYSGEEAKALIAITAYALIADQV